MEYHVFHCVFSIYLRFLVLIMIKNSDCYTIANTDRVNLLTYKLSEKRR